jgi:DNA (cytosine-5)-methyltransferase 1
VLKFIDLFCGIGGLRLGFEQACSDFGIPSKCVLSSEIDRNAGYTYLLNFKEHPRGDVRQINDLPDFDVLLAGFPCQAFSYAGKQLGFGDTRGTLFFEVERFLRQKKPKAFFLENVRGITTHDKGRTFKSIIKHLEDCGYVVVTRIINSCLYGVPQNRVRTYFLGFRGKQLNIGLESNVGPSDSHAFKDFFSGMLPFEGVQRPVLLREILELETDSKYLCSKPFTEAILKRCLNKPESLHGVRLIDYRNGNSFHSWELGLKGPCNKDEISLMNALIANRRKKIFGEHQDGKRLSEEQIKGFYKRGNLNQLLQSLLKKGYLSKKNETYNPVAGNMSFEVFKFLDPDSISLTLTSSDANRLGVYYNKTLRKITPRECARLQGFPDNFKVHPKDRFAYEQMGNAVSVPVVKILCRELIRNLLNDKHVKHT